MILQMNTCIQGYVRGSRIRTFAIAPKVYEFQYKYKSQNSESPRHQSELGFCQFKRPDLRAFKLTETSDLSFGIFVKMPRCAKYRILQQLTILGKWSEQQLAILFISTLNLRVKRALQVKRDKNWNYTEVTSQMIWTELHLFSEGQVCLPNLCIGRLWQSQLPNGGRGVSSIRCC